jgi:MerR family transcriptional regulator, thiopeptide resistance regulator
MSEKRWKIGELAKETGLTVRTLHHYDQLGLLQPSGRTEAGHRLYDERDVGRLYRILALREVGLRLEEISDCLRGEGVDVRTAVRHHLERTDREIELQRRLRERLAAILGALDRALEPSVDDFIEALEVMNRMDKYYTPEQQEALETRRAELGDDAIKRAEQEWSELIEAVEAERQRGTDPSDPRVQALARRWTALIEQFTGGDAGIRRSLQRMYDEEGVEAASRGMLKPETMEYAWRAIEAGGYS